MFELSQLTLDGEVKTRGDVVKLQRDMRRGLAEYNFLGLPYHAVLVNPMGQVVATA